MKSGLIGARLINLVCKSLGSFWPFGFAAPTALTQWQAFVPEQSDALFAREAPGRRGLLMSRRGAEDAGGRETCPCTTSALAG